MLDKRLYQMGERPKIGAIIAVILDNSRTYARVYVPEALRSSVQPGEQLDVRIDGDTRTFTGTVRWVSADASFTPYFALTEHDRSRVSYLAEIDVADASSLPSGVPLEVDFAVSALATD
jgi:HlyD family secretion protein